MNSLTTKQRGIFFRRIQVIIQNRCSDPAFDVNQLCREALLSSDHLQRCLNREEAPPAIDLIHQARLGRASQLLRTTHLTISEIAFASGFNDPNYFTRLFTLKMGCSPGAYRGEF